tara:strand:- start:12 stop:809 length:798 start_codon:yes stop_codon:yes gene_type:complete
MGTPNPIFRKTTLIEATLLHNEAKRLKQPIPHFRDETGALHYIDRRGKSSGGGQYFRDLASKLQTEATRKALKTYQTPTLQMYIDEFGYKKGAELYSEEIKKRQAIYKSTDSSTHDVDHIHSMASGGVHHSRNLRSQPLGDNRSDGARGLPLEAKNALMLADNPRDQIKLQGPALIQKHAQQYIDRAISRVNRAFNQADVIATAFELNGSSLEKAADISRNTTANRDNMAKTARKNGGYNGMPDIGISETLAGKSFINDSRQQYK